MVASNKVIVLSKIRYKDNDLIVKCYSQERGIISYLVRNAFRSKNNRTIAYYQPLSQLLLEERYKQNQSLHFIKEVKPYFLYKTVHTNILKSSIALFLAEILGSVLKEEEENLMLFNYIETSFQLLDIESNFSNFHLLFLLKLTKYLGFYPEESKQEGTIFNLQLGAFNSKTLDINSISESNNQVLKRLLGMNFDGLPSLQLNANQRRDFLNMLLAYFELHLGYFKKPNSLDVFNQVFN